MTTKVYLNIYCDCVGKLIPVSYEVLYFNKKPHLGYCKCEAGHNKKCTSCAVNIEKRKKHIKEHFENIYKKELA